MGGCCSLQTKLSPPSPGCTRGCQAPPAISPSNRFIMLFSREDVARGGGTHQQGQCLCPEVGGVPRPASRCVREATPIWLAHTCMRCVMLVRSAGHWLGAILPVLLSGSIAGVYVVCCSAAGPRCCMKQASCRWVLVWQVRGQWGPPAAAWHATVPRGCVHAPRAWHMYPFCCPLQSHNRMHTAAVPLAVAV
jgi:hypothetical protein